MFLFFFGISYSFIINKGCERRKGGIIDLLHLHQKCMCFHWTQPTNYSSITEVNKDGLEEFADLDGEVAELFFHVTPSRELN